MFLRIMLISSVYSLIFNCQMELAIVTMPLFVRLSLLARFMDN